LSFITLLTDFGLHDGYNGVLKGVIWGILPGAQIADISHNIAPQNIAEGALILARTAFFFPAGTVHVAVVDPGVGTARRPVAIRAGEHTFVGPDNGLFTLVMQRAEKNGWAVEAVTLDQPKYWLPRVSNVFHGRDLFSPVAAHLASGVPLQDVGSPISDPVRLDLPLPVRTAQGWIGRVLAADIYGNIATNLYRSDLDGMTVKRIRIAGEEIQGMVRTFGDRPVGELIALFDSDDELAISVVNGNAAERLKIGPGAEVEVIV
jgi:S-adenosyl-L-methionine hydrolase (adenosine-forming)